MGIFKKKQRPLPVPFMEDSLFGYKDENDDVVILPQFNVAYPFDEKTRTATVMIEKGGDYTFINEYGEITHDETYKWVMSNKGDTVVTNVNFTRVIDPETGDTDALATADLTIKKK